MSRNLITSSKLGEVNNKLEQGDFVSIYGIPAIISRNSDGKLRATYLSDGSFHEDFKLGEYGAKKLPEGEAVSLLVGKGK